MTSGHGFEQYEISNFCRNDQYSRHNSNYWKGAKYIGFGPSAHSYNGSFERSWNIANNPIYIKKLNQNILPKETEILSEKDRFNEMMMIGLRTIWGVDLNKINQNFSPEIIDYFNEEIKNKIESGILKIEENHLLIPEKHWFLADGIASDLFLV